MVKTSTIPFHERGYFSKTICDYLCQENGIIEFSGAFPNLENFKTQIAAKKDSFPAASRTVLVDALTKHYGHISTSKSTKEHIVLLANENTFTVTTRHQLNLFTGPLYFLYKIISVINLAEQLKEAYPTSNFVPVYWMATEDHDFEEIQYFNFKGTKISWNRDATGGVGRLSNEGLEFVFEEFSKLLGTSNNALKLRKLFEDSYLKHETLTEAT